MFFILTTFGAEAYIRKEVAVRSDHASEFFGSLLVFQVIISILLVGIMTIIMIVQEKDLEIFRAVYLFSMGQFFLNSNTKFNSLLQAKGRINAIAILNTVTKVFWGIGIMVGLSIWKHIEVVGAVFFITESIKTPFLYSACRKHINLRLNLNWTVGKAMLFASFPYFLNSLSHTIASKVDVFMLAELTNNQEVGWYGAAANINYIVLLAMPVIIAVVTPMSARIASAGEDELNRTMRSIIRLTFIVTVPLALLVSLNAREIILTLFSEDYLPSVLSTQLLAPGVPLVFICTIFSIQLVQLEKIWQVTKISVISLALNPILNAIVIVPVHQFLGKGGGGFAAASATLVTSLVVAILMIQSLKGAALDKKMIVLFLRFVILCGIFIVVHHFIEFLGFWRGPVELVLYPIVAIPLGVLPVKELLQTAKEFLKSRKKKS